MVIVLNDVASPNNTSVINANFQKIEDSINDDLLKRQIEVGEANEMRTTLDMNSNRIVNLADGIDPQDAVTKAQLDGLGRGTGIVDFATFIQGLPAGAEKLLTIVASTAFTLPAGLTGSKAYAEVVSTAAATFDVRKNGGGSLGTIDFALGTNAATFTFVTPTAFAIGDRVQLTNQSIADVTLADISITLRGDL
jgi:hypothetical protein